MSRRVSVYRPAVVSLCLAVALIVLIAGLSIAETAGSDDFVRLTTLTGVGRYNFDPILSGNGAKIAFYSSADYLGTGIPAGQLEVWLADTETLSLTAVTSASDPLRDSAVWGISHDGQRLAIESDSDFLGEGIPDGVFEVWIYDTSVMTFTRVTSATNLDRDSYIPVLSPDGSMVSFTSDSDFLGHGVVQGQYELWLVDLESMGITQVTEASASDRQSWEPKFDGDASQLVFYSDSDFDSEGINKGQWEIWLYDVEGNGLTRITEASGSDRESLDPVLNKDGTKIVFWSDSDFLGQGIPDNQYEIWLYDLTTSSYTRVTTASHTGRVSTNPWFARNGRLLAFSSNSDFHGEGIGEGQREVWLYDIETEILQRVTEASHSDRWSHQPTLNAAGTKVAFLSDSDFLNQGIIKLQEEVWLATVGYQTFLPLTVRQSD